MPARMPALPVKRVAWLLPRALVHPGEAGLERIDAGALSFQGGQQFPVIGVQLLQDGQVVGVQVVPGGEHLSAEIRPAHQVGLGCLWAEKLFQQQNRRADCAGDSRPALARDSPSRSDWGVEVCVHRDWILATGLVTGYWSLVTGDWLLATGDVGCRITRLWT